MWNLTVNLYNQQTELMESSLRENSYYPGTVCEKLPPIFQLNGRCRF